MTAAEWVFWTCLAALVYVYAGFPAILGLLTRSRRPAPPELPDDRLPTVSFLTAAHNEELVMDEKIRNCLALDYPHGKLNFVFVSDGSNDGTNRILEKFRGNPRIQILFLDPRGGK